MIIRLSFILLILSQGCGYFFAGSWEDDPNNWIRAYNQEKPDDIQIVHSYFERFAHWSYEFDFYIQIQPNSEFLQKIIAERELVPAPASDKLASSNNRPAWFLPKPTEEYTVFSSPNKFDSFELYVDNETGDIFWNETQF